MLSRTTDFSDQGRDYFTYLEVRYTIPEDNPTRHIVELQSDFEEAIADIDGNTITGWVDVGRVIFPENLSLNDIPVNEAYEGMNFNIGEYSPTLYEVPSDGDLDGLIFHDCFTGQDVLDANSLNSFDEVNAGMILLIPSFCR